MSNKILALLTTLIVLAIPASASAGWSEFQRTNNPYNGDHYYSMNLSNIYAAGGVGYQYEGFEGYGQNTNEPSTIPIYGAYHAASAKHVLTSQAGYNSLGNDWTKEGVTIYVSATQTADTMPLYGFRLSWNNKYFYTTKETEKDYLINNGHTYEGILGYVWKRAPKMVQTYQHSYSDGRPAPAYRLPSENGGMILSRGSGIDSRGLRDAYLYQENGTYYLTYDAIDGNYNWASALATSTDLTNWTKHGVINDESVSCGCYTTIQNSGNDYISYYFFSQNNGSDGTPSPAYDTHKARATSPFGPWTKEGNVFPNKQSYYSLTATPGPIVQDNGQYIMFFSAGDWSGRRNLGMARSNSIEGPWTPDTNAIVPNTEQVENIAIHKQGSTWYLFTNHVGINSGGEYTDAIWVYWTNDINNWSTSNRAVVVDGRTSWSPMVVGVPTIVEKNGRLGIIYDGRPDTGQSHIDRDLGINWIDLPINNP